MLPGSSVVMVACGRFFSPTSPSEKTAELIDAIRKLGYKAEPEPSNSFGARRILFDGSPNRKIKVNGNFVGIGPPLADDKLTLDVPRIKIPADAVITVL
ncbi:MAG: hypothetical protein HY395_01290 [Candidatus Doudnabacteria bacterium]|nr:hypothetical protein [Candidatus Doudnabacteria bacterium]